MTGEKGDEVLLGLISEALETRDQGGDLDLKAICADNPDLIHEVAKALGLAQRLPDLQRDAAGHDPFLGMVFDDRYRLDARLGAGAMGVVYDATDLELQRNVAVKLLHTSLLDAQEADRRFEREAEALASISHRAVVTVYDRGRTGGGQPYLVMERLHGLPLDAVLESVSERTGSDVAAAQLCGELGLDISGESSFLRIAVRWAAELAAGLEAAHASGVYHRDLKPSNVFLREKGGPVLIDFGIAARDAHPTLVERDGLLGTPAYMAPEAMQPGHTATRTRDVYSLAATLYHMLTLRAPYEGTPSQVLGSLERRDPLPVQRARPGLARDLRAVVECGMRRDPHSRYASAGAFEADLSAFLNHIPVQARPTTVVGRTWRRMRRSPAAKAAFGVACLAVGTAGFVAWQNALEAARRTESMEVRASIPPGYPLWKQSARRLVGAERDALGERLDRAVELASNALPERLLRACFRLDHGDTRGAILDVNAIAEELNTPFVRALQASYVALPMDADGARALELVEMPTPQTAEDKYLMAFHLLRNIQRKEDVATARTLLEDPSLGSYTPAQEILLPLAVGSVPLSWPRRDRADAFREIHESAVRIEASRGIRSATTAHVIGAALIGMEQHDEAIAPIEAGIALAPNFHGLHSNLGIAGLRTARFDAAREHLERAIDLRPNVLNPYQTLVRVHLRTRAYEVARSVIRDAPIGTSAKERRWAAALSAEVDYREALDLLEQRQEGAVELASRAIETYEGAGLAEDHPDYGLDVIICRAVVSGTSRPACIPILNSLETDPSNWGRLRLFLQFMPTDLTAGESQAMRNFLLALCRREQPEDRPDPLSIPESQQR